MIYQKCEYITEHRETKALLVIDLIVILSILNINRILRWKIGHELIEGGASNSEI